MLKIEEKTKNIREGPIKILVFTTCRVIIEKFHQKQPKFQPWWNSSVKKKPYACYAFKDSEIKCLQPPLFTHSCLCVFFSKAALIKSKAKQIFNKTILKIVGTHFFLVESLAVWRIIRNQFEPVWAEIAKNSLSRKLELLIPQNRYTCHQGVMWQIKGIPIDKVSFNIKSGWSTRKVWT